MVVNGQRVASGGNGKVGLDFVPFSGERASEPFGEAVGVFTSGPYKGKRARFTVGFTPVTTKIIFEDGSALPNAFYLSLDILNGEFELREVYVADDQAVRNALREGRMIERRGLCPTRKGNKIEYVVYETCRGVLENAEFKSGELSLGIRNGKANLCLVNYETVKLLRGLFVVIDAHQPIERALQVHISLQPTAI